MFRKITCFSTPPDAPRILANSNKNYRRYNFQAFDNISGNFRKYFRKITTLYAMGFITLRPDY